MKEKNEFGINVCISKNAVSYSMPKKLTGYAGSFKNRKVKSETK